MSTETKKTVADRIAELRATGMHRLELYGIKRRPEPEES